MLVEDRSIAKYARAAIARTPLDISELNISCSHGVLELVGKVKPPRNHTGDLNLKKELEVMKQQLRNVRGVKDVYADRVQLFDQ